MNKAFVLYTEYSQKFRRLSDEQLGKLLRVIFKYEETGEVPEIEDTLVAFAFDIVQPDLAKQYEKYQSKVNAGKRSGEQRKKATRNEEEQTGTEMNKREQNEQNDDLFTDAKDVQVCCPNKKEKEKEKEKEKKKERGNKENTPRDPDVVYAELVEENPPAQIARNPYAPSLLDVKEFCALKNLCINPEAFFYNYESQDWKINGQNFDWRKRAMAWHAQDKGKHKPQTVTGSKTMDLYLEEFGMEEP